ncbi:hypothetical protein BJ741DRAFT_682210 [Chytriomyces cf. hyalinus JEL632]|nr:hypothetical protein BJ741DRAFT_682210 [Chytriomyces cf. hyalinus JEL632]
MAVEMYLYYRTEWHNCRISSPLTDNTIWSRISGGMDPTNGLDGLEGSAGFKGWDSTVGLKGSDSDSGAGFEGALSIDKQAAAVAGEERKELLKILKANLCELQTYSAILSKHGGYARIVEAHQMIAILGALPMQLEVRLEYAEQLNNTDTFFETMLGAKKSIRKLTFGVLSSLHLRTLEDIGSVALSECKSLCHLSISKLFDGAEGPEVLVQQLLDILKDAKILQLEVFLPWGWQKFLPAI